MKLSTLLFNIAITSTCAFAPLPIGIKHDVKHSALQMSKWEDDAIVTLVPKFKIKDGMRDQYMQALPKFVDLVKANEEETCVFYGFVGPTEDGYVICREGYVSAEGLLKHLDNVGDVLNEALQSADIVDLMVQGPANELEKLKEPPKDFSPTYYPLVPGAIRNKSNFN
mmetsp:Transcript_22528/g.25652  ORF Transcript_22528/g.25652 Transcript_22528/m.25652 type:complete len:168 (+) Transcript_22528:47-550(+)